MRIRAKIGGSLAAFLLAVAGTVAFGGTAYAGSNGQQLLLLNNSGAAGSFKLVGYDQNGNPVSTCKATTGWKTWFSGWYWKGSLSFTPYYSSDCTGVAQESGRTQWIPASSSNDWQAITDTSTTFGGATQQIVFFDNQHIANSVWVSGENQNGQQVGHCWTTPSWENSLSGWWWRYDVTVQTFSSSDCSGGSNGTSKSRYDVGQAAGAWYGVNN
ncbi:hypothetical protein [Streptomyces sp. NPDC091371]|uniref:hypothetical protein n=1 Tax=Streptomyces sp. NPDC091371 TaxID=3155303 RepID=UPI003417168B